MKRDLTNSPGGELAIEKLRQFKGLKNVSDEDAENILITIKKFARLTFQYYKELKK